MKSATRFGLFVSLVFVLGCQNELKVSDNEEPATSITSTTQVVNQIVESSCGQCQFGMEGNGCDLAVRIDGESYYVDGAMLDDHGDAHGDDGMCNCVRQAKVSGEVADGRFTATSFELLPFDKEQQAAAKVDSLKTSRIGAAFAMSDQGLVVKDIWEAGAGGKAGLEKGDKIVKLNNQPVADLDSDALRAVLADSKTVDFSIERDGEALEISVPLSED